MLRFTQKCEALAHVQKNFKNTVFLSSATICGELPFPFFNLFIHAAQHLQIFEAKKV